MTTRPLFYRNPSLSQASFSTFVLGLGLAIVGLASLFFSGIDSVPWPMDGPVHVPTLRTPRTSVCSAPGKRLKRSSSRSLKKRYYSERASFRLFPLLIAPRLKPLRPVVA